MWLLGRAHQVVRTGEENLYPVPVEAVAGQVARVRRAALVEVNNRAVVAIESVTSSKRTAAKDGLSDAVMRACTDAGFSVDAVEIVAVIPVDPRHNAKVDTERLRLLLQRAA